MEELKRCPFCGEEAHGITPATIRRRKKRALMRSWLTRCIGGKRSRSGAVISEVRVDPRD